MFFFISGRLVRWHLARGENFFEICACYALEGSERLIMSHCLDETQEERLEVMR